MKATEGISPDFLSRDTLRHFESGTRNCVSEPGGVLSSHKQVETAIPDLGNALDMFQMIAKRGACPDMM